MTTFNEAVHTPEALSCEISALRDRLPDARLVGSLGRSIVYGNVLGNPVYEFAIRNQDPLSVANIARDIDVLGVSRTEVDSFGPFEVDATGYSTRFVNIVRDGIDWFIVSKCHDFAEPLKPEVVEPFSGEAVFGIEAVTLPPQTQLALYGLKGRMREKDIKTRDMLKAIVMTHDQTDLYPDEFLEPIRDLATLNSRSLYVRAQDMYRRVVPNRIRARAVPFMRLAKKII